MSKLLARMAEGPFSGSGAIWHGTAHIHIVEVSFLPSKGSLSELAVVMVNNL